MFTNCIKSRRNLALSITITALLFTSYISNQLNLWYHISTEVKYEPASISQNMTILVWSRPKGWHHRYVSPNSEYKLLECCGGCIVTTKRENFHKAEIIALHAEFDQEDAGFPSNITRLPHQKYIFWTHENPYKYKVLRKSWNTFRKYDDQFNATMSYRRSSDITLPYGGWWEKRFPKIVMSEKTGVALMLASDCHRYGGILRKHYSQELIKHGLKLERKGRCFGDRYNGDLPSLLKRFKFFMAFENSIHCRDYITEKFWKRSLAMGVVPVVWGPEKSDLEEVAPPHSFIHVEDFESPKELVQYLNYLDKNNSAYLEYFKWRDLTLPDYGNPCNNARRGRNKLCRMCKWATKNRGTHILPSLTDWFFSTEAPECLAANAKELSKVPYERIKRLIPGVSLKKMI